MDKNNEYLIALNKEGVRYALCPSCPSWLIKNTKGVFQPCRQSRKTIPSPFYFSHLYLQTLSLNLKFSFQKHFTIYQKCNFLQAKSDALLYHIKDTEYRFKSEAG